MCTKLQLNVNLFPVVCFLMEVNTFCGHARLNIVSSAYVNVEISRRIASSLQAITDFSFQVFLSAFHFGKYGLQLRVWMSSGDNQDK